MMMATPHTSRWLRPACMLLLALAGCGGSEEPAYPAPDLTEDGFIDTFIALREAEHVAVSPEEFQTMRDSILGAHDTSAEELRAFVRHWSRDLGRMSATWDTIEARLRRRADEAQRTAREEPGV